MADDALTVAKEITLAVISRVPLQTDPHPEPTDEKYGKLFQVILT